MAVGGEIVKPPMTEKDSQSPHASRIELASGQVCRPISNFAGRRIPRLMLQIDAKHAFRMGNYSLLAYMGWNIGLELIYSGPHFMLSRMHLNNMHAAPGPGPNQ
jgi:hypothetical protein